MLSRRAVIQRTPEQTTPAGGQSASVAKPAGTDGGTCDTAYGIANAHLVRNMKNDHVRQQIHMIHPWIKAKSKRLEVKPKEKDDPDAPGRVADAQDEKAASFLEWARRCFQTDEATIAHFEQIEKVPGSSIYLHASAASGVEKARASLKEKGLPVPDTTVGQWFRGISAEASVDVHDLGYAVDFEAAKNPHIKDGRLKALVRVGTGEEAQKDEALKVPQGGDAHHMNMPSKTSKTIGAMGSGKLDPSSDEAVKFFAKVKEEWDRFAATSKKLTQTLGDGGGDPAEDPHKKLDTLREQYLAAKERGGPTADERKDISGRLQKIFAPWLEKIDRVTKRLIAEIKAATQSAENPEGIDAGKLPDLDETGDKVDAAPKTKKRAAGDRKNKPDPAAAEEITKLNEILDGAIALVQGSASEPEPEAGGKKKRPPSEADKLARLKKLLKMKNVLPSVEELQVVERLRKSLTEDLEFVFVGKRDAENPSVTQVAKQGVFNPNDKSGFNWDFGKAMMASGFYPGGGWNSPDSMHYELVESLRPQATLGKKKSNCK